MATNKYGNNWRWQLAKQQKTLSLLSPINKWFKKKVSQKLKEKKRGTKEKMEERGRKNKKTKSKKRCKKEGAPSLVNR